MQSQTSECKIIEIQTADPELQLMAETLRLRSGFMALGFTRRQAFITLVQDSLPKYGGYAGAMLLISWWQYRGRDQELNNHLEDLLNTLQYE